MEKKKLYLGDDVEKLEAELADIEKDLEKRKTCLKKEFYGRAGECFPDKAWKDFDDDRELDRADEQEWELCAVAERLKAVRGDDKFCPYVQNDIDFNESVRFIKRITYVTLDPSGVETTRIVDVDDVPITTYVYFRCPTEDGDATSENGEKDHFRSTDPKDIAEFWENVKIMDEAPSDLSVEDLAKLKKTCRDKMKDALGSYFYLPRDDDVECYAETVDEIDEKDYNDALFAPDSKYVRKFYECALAMMHLGRWKEMYDDMPPQWYDSEGVLCENDIGDWSVMVEYSDGRAPWFSEGKADCPLNIDEFISLVTCDDLEDFYDDDDIDPDIEELRAYAEDGDAEAQCELGVCCYVGDGVDKNRDEAVKWFTKSAEQGNAYAQYALGTSYFDLDDKNRDPAKAAVWFEKALDGGVADAGVLLGLCYDTGDGVEEDPVKAYEAYLRGADLGNANAQYLVANAYVDGRGCERDDVKAVLYYEKGAAQGHPGALFNLAVSYRLGRGVAEDPKKVVELTRRAIDASDSRDPLMLCAMAEDYRNGYGVRKNLKKSVDLFEEAAEMGCAVAMGALAWMYAEGKGCKRDFSKVFSYAFDSHEAGIDEAKPLLAMCYEFGIGTEIDYGIAATLYKELADEGDSFSQERLGAFYMLGQGVQQDSKKAAYWFAEAAAQGNVGAQKKLGACFVAGEGVRRDIKSAIKMYEMAALSGDVESILCLGYCYEEGITGKIDYNKAVEYFERAAGLGSHEGEAALERVRNILKGLD